MRTSSIGEPDVSSLLIPYRQLHTVPCYRASLHPTPAVVADLQIVKGSVKERNATQRLVRPVTSSHQAVLASSAALHQRLVQPEQSAFLPLPHHLTVLHHFCVSSIPRLFPTIAHPAVVGSAKTPIQSQNGDLIHPPLSFIHFHKNTSSTGVARVCGCPTRAVVSGNLTARHNLTADPPHGIHLFWVLRAVASPRLFCLLATLVRLVHPNTARYKSLPHSRLGTPTLPVHIHLVTSQPTWSLTWTAPHPRHSRLLPLSPLPTSRHRRERSLRSLSLQSFRFFYSPSSRVSYSSSLFSFPLLSSTPVGPSWIISTRRLNSFYPLDAFHD